MHMWGCGLCWLFLAVCLEPARRGWVLRTTYATAKVEIVPLAQVPEYIPAYACVAFLLVFCVRACTLDCIRWLCRSLRSLLLFRPRPSSFPVRRAAVLPEQPVYVPHARETGRAVSRGGQEV